MVLVRWLGRRFDDSCSPRQIVFRSPFKQRQMDSVNFKPIAAMNAKTKFWYVVFPLGLVVLIVVLSIETFKHFGGIKDWGFKHWDVLLGALILWRQNQIMVRQNRIMEQQKDGDVRPVLVMEYEARIIPKQEREDVGMNPFGPVKAHSFRIENVGFGPAGQTWLRLDNNQDRLYVGTIGHGRTTEVDLDLYAALRDNRSTIWLEYKSLYGRTYSSNVKFENGQLVNRTESSFSFLTGYSFFPLSFNTKLKQWTTNLRWHWLSLRYKDDELIEKHGKGEWF
jgi:hypothetical protein